MTDRYGLPVPRTWSELDEIRAARALLVEARRSRDAAAIATACLELVGMLIERHRLLGASWALEDAIHALLSDAEETQTTHEGLWNLYLTLAMVEAAIGETLRAHDTARRALTHAIRADSSIGRARSRELLQRLIGDPEDRPTQRIPRPRATPQCG